jgi:glycosyltransferase involved in cell wall biosynthesis
MVLGEQMKFCIISTCAVESSKAGYKGIERIAWQIADWLGKKGHDVTLVASKGSEKGNFRLVETLNPGYTVPGVLEMEEEHITEAVKKLKGESFDILQVHQHNFYLSTLWINAKRYEWHIHGWLPYFPPNKNIVCYARSKAHAELLKDRFMREVSYMYNFIDTKDFPLVKEKEDYLLFFSRLSKEKGAHNFLKLCKELNCKGIIAGEDSQLRGIEPSYLIELLKDIANYNSKGGKIEYLGAVDEKTKIELLSKAKALVIPYEKPYFEVFGIMIIEALAVGTPVLTLKGFGGPDEIITEDVGYLANDFNDLKEKAKQLLNGEISFSPEACRKRAEDFDIDKVMNDYLKSITTKEI